MNVVHTLAAVNCTFWNIDTTFAPQYHPCLILHFLRLWKMDFLDCINFEDKLKLPSKSIQHLEKCVVYWTAPWFSQNWFAWITSDWKCMLSNRFALSCWKAPQIFHFFHQQHALSVCTVSRTENAFATTSAVCCRNKSFVRWFVPPTAVWKAPAISRLQHVW